MIIFLYACNSMFWQTVYTCLLQLRFLTSFPLKLDEVVSTFPDFRSDLLHFASCIKSPTIFTACRVKKNSSEELLTWTLQHQAFWLAISNFNFGLNIQSKKSINTGKKYWKYQTHLRAPSGRFINRLRDVILQKERLSFQWPKIDKGLTIWQSTNALRWGVCLGCTVCEWPSNQSQSSSQCYVFFTASMLGDVQRIHERFIHSPF